jgi:hypothetical protein
LQAFGGDAGKQIGIDLVVFTHGGGLCAALAFKAGTLVAAVGFVHATHCRTRNFLTQKTEN